MHHRAAIWNVRDVEEERGKQQDRESHGESFDPYSQESKAFLATYEANEDEPSFEQRDLHECL